MASIRFPRFDPRLIAGLVLVAASVGGVVAVVQSANTTVPMYVVTSPVAAGEPIRLSDLESVDVKLDTAQSLYLNPGDLRDDDEFVATRPLGEGELVPLSALGDPDTSTASVVVSISGTLPAAIGTGAQVEVWSAAPGERPGVFEPPVVLVSSADVVRLVESESFVAHDVVEVELRVPDRDTASILAAMSNGAKLQLVPRYEPATEVVAGGK